MKNYLFIGGIQDGVNARVAPDQEVIHVPVGAKNSETYIRDRLSVGDSFISIYRHESLTSRQALNRVVEHYKAWSTYRPRK